MEFKSELLNLNLNIDDNALSLFESYYSKLVEVNEYMNLTAITEHDDVYIKHFYDSLTLLTVLDKNAKTLCDIGGGAGFPSVPVAIANKELNVTVVDALNKRINFLNDVKGLLSLDNFSAVHARAEDYQKKYRESYDVVTARAVARLNVLSELCLPLVKLGGSFVAMKGSESEQELKEALNGIKLLGGEVEKTVSLELPYGAGKRELIVIRKVKATPTKYPRAFAKIKERPL